MEGVVLAVRQRNADVVGLDVTVGNAFAFQKDDRLKEVLAEALQQIEAEPAFLAKRLPRVLSPAWSRRMAVRSAN